jgi:aminopeptidase N
MRRTLALPIALLTLLASPGIAAEEPPAAIPTGMLPPVAKPIAYDLQLTILPENARFSGHTVIDIDLSKPTHMLWINGKDLSVSRVEAHAAAAVSKGRYRQVDPNGVARIDFDRTLPAGRISLQIDYDAPFETGSHGLYHVKVNDSWYAWSNDEPTEARTIFPCFDEPGFKTPFAVSIATTPGLTAVSNAPDADVVRSGSLEIHHFARSNPLPTYLLAVAVGPLASKAGIIAPTPQRPKPLPLRVFATKGLANHLEFATDNTGWFITRLENFFNLPYPFPKLDLAATPAMQGGMENAGLVMDDDDSLLFSEHGSVGTQQRFAILQAHELAHQWFGDFVTPRWWTDSWLNESFADWMGYLIGDPWRPQLHLQTRAFRDAFGSMELDALTAGRPVHTATTNTLVDADLDVITYGKGSQVIGMIEGFVGEEKFRKAVQLHLTRHAYGNATAADFYQALSDATQQPALVQAMRSFIDQPGVPVIDVVRKGGQLELTQTRFTQLGSPTPKPIEWSIPLCVRQGSERTCRLMTTARLSIPARSAPLMPNAGGVGYYRFNLSDKDWSDLIAMGPTLSVGEALATTDSLWAAFRAGKASSELLLQATARFAAHADWTVATDNASRWLNLRDSGLVDEATADVLRKRLAEIYEPKLKDLGFDPKKGAYASEPLERAELRSRIVSILAVGAKSRDVRAVLDRAAKDYLAGNPNALDVSYLEVALQVHVQDGGREAAKALFERVIDSDDATLRQAALSAVGESANKETAAWLVQQILDPRLVEREKSQLFSALLAAPQTRDLAFTWLEARVSQDATTRQTFWHAVSAAPFCSDEWHDVQTLLTPLTTDPRRTLGIDRALETMRDCATLRSTRGSELAAALKDSVRLAYH